MLLSLLISLDPLINLTTLSSAPPIWEEDFGGGFPSGWSTYTNNTGAGNSGSLPGNTAECPWKYSMQGSWGYWNSVGTNAAGNPTAAAAPINPQVPLAGSGLTYGIGAAECSLCPFLNFPIFVFV